MDVTLMLFNTAKGLAAGAGASFIGYFKTQNEKFDGYKLIKTTLIGGFTGAVAGYMDVPINNVAEYASYPFIIYGIDAVTKIVYNKVYAPLKAILQKLSPQ